MRRVDIGVVLGFDGGRGRGMDALTAAARHVEELGLSSFWAPDHVVFVEGAESRYPYGKSGRAPVGRRPGVYDPFVALAAAAAVTSRIRLGTGVLILPQREPLNVAQQAVAVDHAAAGRLDLGIGVGWLREECEALGVPWARRGERTDEYVRLMRALWRDDVVDFEGEFVSVRGIQAWPKPLQSGGVPVWVGGNTDAALRRVAAVGDGWYGWLLDADQAAERIAFLRAACEAEGRDPATVGLKLGLPWPGSFDTLPDYVASIARLGVTELVLAPHAADIALHDRLLALATAADSVRSG